MVSTAHFRYAETEPGAVSFEVERAFCKGSIQNRALVLNLWIYNAHVLDISLLVMLPGDKKGRMQKNE